MPNYGPDVSAPRTRTDEINRRAIIEGFDHTRIRICEADMTTEPKNRGDAPEYTAIMSAVNYTSGRVGAECMLAMKKHDSMNSAHEAYSVILEELHEFREHVRAKGENRNKHQMALELIKIAAMCVRAIVDLGLPLSEFGNEQSAEDDQIPCAYCGIWHKPPHCHDQ